MVKLWLRFGGGGNGGIRGICSAIRRSREEGDWMYSSEWWTPGGADSRTVFRETSVNGNGVVSVEAFPSSRPSREEWGEGEEWLRRKMCLFLPVTAAEEWVVRGYQWRMLMFNHTTRQTTVKVMVASTALDPESMLIIQQPHCIPVPYLKSLVSAGMTAICASNYDLAEAVSGCRTMRILCIGHGGGSLPLFLATKIQGAVVHSVEIDPVVVSASVRAMGFPALSAGGNPSPMDEALWGGVWGRVSVHQTDAKNFVVAAPLGDVYDMVFVDAYDGGDIFPHKLWGSVFLEALGRRTHPEHGTVVVNLHSDHLDDGWGGVRKTGSYLWTVSQSYVDALIGRKEEGVGVGFAVSAPHVCNTTLVVCRGLEGGGGVLDRLLSKCGQVQNSLDLVFPCLDYVERGFVLIQ